MLPTIELTPVRKDTILPSLFDTFDSGIKCAENSVERQEPVTLSSYVVITGVILLLLRGGGIPPVHNPPSIVRNGTRSSVVARVYSGCYCVFQFANQGQLLKCLFCYFL